LQYAIIKIIIKYPGLDYRQVKRMENYFREHSESWQDSIEALSQEIRDCSKKLQDDPFLACVKTVFIASRSAQQQLDAWAKNNSASRIQFALLHSLILNGGRMTPTQIGKEISRSKYAVTRIVDSLEKRGLVKREPFGDDLRTKDVIVTRKGIQIVNERTEYFQKYVIPKVITDLNKKQIADLKKLLQLEVIYSNIFNDKLE
jgi:DNA-binding MarR family transcriptional regulator